METDSISGHLILFMAPSGSGKGSLERELFKAYPEIVFPVSCTTRLPRPGEVEGKDYYYVSREDFETRVAREEFVEWAEFGGHLYGTLKSEIETPLQEGKIVLNEIERQGVEQFIKIIPAQHRTIIYIEAGEWEELKSRVLSRAPMTDEELSLRHARYKEEITMKPYADIVIENHQGEFDNAAQELIATVGKIINNLHNT